MSNTTNPTTLPQTYRVVLPALVRGEQEIPGSSFLVHAAPSKSEAVERAIAEYRTKHNIPSSVTIPKATLQTVPQHVGKTINSASGTARWKGRTIKG